MLRPFFPYYGSKYRSARLYGPPLPGTTVVEPFAGSAGYATYWNPPEVLLVDADPIIVGVWDYLIRVPPAEVLRLPDLAVGEDVSLLPLPQEAKWLIGFWLNRGSAMPKRSRTAYSERTDRAQLVWGQRARERIASQVESIRGWAVVEGSYDTLGNPPTTTWFIDPPYVDKGRYYRCRSVDYPRLADWCRGRQGHVIVCENAGAAWLPFRPLATIKSTKGTSAEVVWTG